MIPAGASQPLIKPRSIDDVPILALTLWSSRADGFALRRIAAPLDKEIKAIPDVSETRLIGGLRRQLGVTLDRDRMAGYGVDTAAVLGALGESNRELRAGSFAQAVVDAGAVRFRPMLLTASAVVVGASVMLFDPIFQGLAISLMAGEVASTLLSRMAVPVLYYLA
ncbi:MAG: efflux RND transporter permease subunit, partial [candidate division NC10 bacterium]